MPTLANHPSFYIKPHLLFIRIINTLSLTTSGYNGRVAGTKTVFHFLFNFCKRSKCLKRMCILQWQKMLFYAFHQMSIRFEKQVIEIIWDLGWCHLLPAKIPVCCCQALGDISILNAMSGSFMVLTAQVTGSWAAIHTKAAFFQIHLMKCFTCKNTSVHIPTDKDFLKINPRYYYYT